MKADAATREKLAEIGKMIRAARERVGVSQATLAQQIGMLRENYIRVEKGRVNLTVETMLRVADGLGSELIIRVAPKKKKVTPKKSSRTA